MKLQYNQHPQLKLNLSKFAFLWIIVANLSAWARLNWAAGLLVTAAQSIWYLWVNHRWWRKQSRWKWRSEVMGMEALWKLIWQGLGYSRDSAAKVLTKFCTPNSSPIKFWPCTNKFFSSQAFQPCMTLWVQNWPKLPKKIIFPKKSH